MKNSLIKQARQCSYLYLNVQLLFLSTQPFFILLTSAQMAYAPIWIVETVDSIGGEYSSIAVDSSGNPHISYHDATNDALKYAVKSGGS